MPVLFLTHVLKKKKTCFIDPRGENLFFFHCVVIFTHYHTGPKYTHTCTNKPFIDLPSQCRTSVTSSELQTPYAGLYGTSMAHLLSLISHNIRPTSSISKHCPVLNSCKALFTGVFTQAVRSLQLIPNMAACVLNTADSWCFSK